MQELLFELGCEELPASFVRRAYEQLEREVVSRLNTANVEHRAARSMGTPRRLIVQVADVADRQPDQVKEQRGPGVKAAFDAEGAPTKALQGFCRSQGVDPADVRTEGDYVWVTKTIPGKPTAELLQTILPDAVKSLVFDKTMRWGTTRMRFARPIRWLLASFGGQVVPFEVDSVASGAISYGHRFNRPEPFEARDFQTLMTELRNRDVEPDPAVRERRVREGAAQVASGTPELPEALVEENVFLTEWPQAVEGVFPEEYLQLPEPVLVTAMAKHERFFPVRSEGGKLTNRFVAIRNGGDETTVREGNQWVLNARFNDAKFFFDEDAKLGLTDFLQRTERMTFQDKLGSVRARADRLASLSRKVAELTGADLIDAQLADDAGLYAKADLSCGLVGELPSLQGVIGGEYAKRDRFHQSVCYAIGTHYDLGKNLPPSSQPQRTAVRVLMADQIDKLAGYLGLGLAPSGSSDPFGLRRAVTMLIEASLSWESPIGGYAGLFKEALKAYKEQGVKLDGDAALRFVEELFGSRYPIVMPEARYDLLDAAMLPGGELMNPRGVRTRLRALEILCLDVPFVQAATRPLNIVAAAEKKGVAFAKKNPMAKLDRQALDSPEGLALADVLTGQAESLRKAVKAENAEGIVASLKPLEKTVNAFFEATMVMVEDEQVRAARLTLLQGACDALLQAGDFGKIVVEG